MNTDHQHQRALELKASVHSSVATRWTAVLIGLAMILLGAKLNAAPAPKEHELKAAFLYNFTKFVEWPANSSSSPDAPFVIGVAGDSPCRAELEQIAKERRVNGRPLVIKPLNSTRDVKGVHMLFVAASEESRVEDWLNAAHGESILTVGESPQFLKAGGAINLSLEGEKIRFEINMEPADASGLKISAQLQKLAKSVRRKS